MDAPADHLKRNVKVIDRRNRDCDCIRSLLVKQTKVIGVTLSAIEPSHSLGRRRAGVGYSHQLDAGDF
jgi:hypothetical protein